MQIGAEFRRFSDFTQPVTGNYSSSAHRQAPHISDDGVPLRTLAARTLAPEREGKGHVDLRRWKYENQKCANEKSDSQLFFMKLRVIRNHRPFSRADSPQVKSCSSSPL